mmetsp:Transcript_91260/g.209171  ORF Transcript_91260/g.209171 Transcript_91260/m.209171 type:complete len:211 (-) Transcript_91260:59-691(-)
MAWAALWCVIDAVTTGPSLCAPSTVTVTAETGTPVICATAAARTSWLEAAHSIGSSASECKKNDTDTGSADKNFVVDVVGASVVGAGGSVETSPFVVASASAELLVEASVVVAVVAAGAAGMFSTSQHNSAEQGDELVHNASRAFGILHFPSPQGSENDAQVRSVLHNPPSHTPASPNASPAWQSASTPQLLKAIPWSSPRRSESPNCSA